MEIDFDFIARAELVGLIYLAIIAPLGFIGAWWSVYWEEIQRHERLPAADEFGERQP